MVYSLGLFQFCDHGNVAIVRGDDLLDGAHVGGAAHKRERDCVHAVREPEFEILAVFRSQGRDGKADARQIDSLMLAQSSAIQDVADNIFAARAANPQFDESVGEQDARARFHFARQVRERGGDSRGRAGNVSRRDDDG